MHGKDEVSGYRSDQEGFVIRQAQTYFASAVSGTALIGAAIVAFVLLVSLQALRDWPLAGIGGTGGGGAQERTGAGEGASQAAGTSAKGGEATARAGAGGTAGAHRNGADGKAVGHAGTGVGGTPSSGAQAPRLPESAQAGSGGGSTGSSAGSDGKSSGGSAGGGESSQSATGTVAKTVNETVSGVDEATGGTLGETGVTKVTEETANGLLGGAP